MHIIICLQFTASWWMSRSCLTAMYLYALFIYPHGNLWAGCLSEYDWHVAGEVRQAITSHDLYVVLAHYVCHTLIVIPSHKLCFKCHTLCWSGKAVVCLLAYKRGCGLIGRVGVGDWWMAYQTKKFNPRGLSQIRKRHGGSLRLGSISCSV